MKVLLAVVVAGCSAKQGAAQVDAQMSTDTLSIDGPAPPRMIPVTMMETPAHNFVGTVQISIGGSAPITAFLDTGSTGLRVVTGAIPDADWTIGTQTSSITYSGGVIANGVIATAIVKIGDYTSPMPIAMQDITSVACTAAEPNCPAKNTAAADFRFVANLSAIIGVGMAVNTTTGIASPLAALGATYVLAMPVNGGSAGTIAIDPDPARFTNRVQLPARGAGWNDSQVPFCLNQLCGNALLDTGVPFYALQAAAGDFAKLGVPDGSTTIPTGTPVAVALNGVPEYSFTVGALPMLGVDLAKINSSSGPQTFNLGLNPFYQLDMFYDYSAGMIGIAPKD